ncbi:MAG: two-component regulator propeller domain-containing protein, partial [Anaerolineales bacterium]
MELVFQVRQGPDWPRFTSANSPLLSDEIYALETDEVGNIYIGTNAGLSIYSPEGEWTSITSRNSDMIGDWVYSVYPASDGRIWLGTQDGLSVLKQDGTGVSYGDDKLCANPAIYVIESDAEGNVWVGSRCGLYVTDSFGQSLQVWPIELGGSSAIADLFADSQNRLWVGSERGLGYITDDGTNVVFTEEDLGVRIFGPKGFVEGSDGRILVRIGRQLAAYNGEWKLARFLPTSSSADRRQDLIFDNKGRLWAGVSGTGLVYVDGDSREVFTPQNSGMQHYVPIVLMLDDTGFLWVGSLDARTSLYSSLLYSKLEGQGGVSWLDLNSDLPRVAPSELKRARSLVTI